MQSKDNQNQPNSSEQQTASSSFRFNELIWNGLNFTTVAALTSGTIVAIQSPVKTVLVNFTKNGTFLPSYAGGSLAFMRAIYAGTFSSLTGSSMRTLYVTGTKKLRPGAEIQESLEITEKEQVSALHKTGYVLAAAFGDIVVTQIPESLSQYKKMPGFLPQGFKWNTLHNSRQLMMGGFMPRYLSGLVNFGSLCVVEDRIAENLPIEDEKTRHFTAGALSGMTAAFFSFPLTAFKDYTLVQSRVDEGGKLTASSTLTVMKELGTAFVKNPKAMGQAFFKSAAKQLPIRMGLTGTIFSTIAGMGAVLGSEPLDAVVPERFKPERNRVSYGFFSQPEPAADKAPAAPAAERHKP